MPSLVYDFAGASKDMQDRLGGKGASLPR